MKVKVKVTQSCLTLCDPMDLVYGIFQARILEWIAFLFSKGSSQSRDQTQSPALQANSLPAEPPGKPKNTGVGSLSLLQGIFPTQESNWGLLPCRWILYHLSHQGSPKRRLPYHKGPRVWWLQTTETEIIFSIVLEAPSPK